MRAPFTQLYLHCIWATWDRMPLVVNEVERAVYAAVMDKCRELKCDLIAIGGMPDHVHLLVRLHTTVAVATLLKEVKGASSHLITHQITPGSFFKWQGAYGAFTVGKEAVPIVQRYIGRQREHHTNTGLWDEWEQTFIDDLAPSASD